MDVFTSTNVVKFSPKLAVEELKILPNETIGAAVLLEKYKKISRVISNQAGQK